MLSQEAKVQRDWAQSSSPEAGKNMGVIYVRVPLARENIFHFVKQLKKKLCRNIKGS